MAGQIVKHAPIVGGGDGGRADLADAGGKDPSKVDEMLAASRGVIEKMLSAWALIPLRLDYRIARTGIVPGSFDSR